MICVFCLAESGTVKMSKEHLFSVPICTALGVDRTKLVASLDGNTGIIGHATPLDRRQVRLPCAKCNSGWMGQLEQDTARALRRWLTRPGSRLTTAGHSHLVRWDGQDCRGSRIR